MRKRIEKVSKLEGQALILKYHPPLSKNMSQNQFAERRDERKSPEEAKDVGKLHPREILTSSELDELALDVGTQLVARCEGLGRADGGQGRLGGAASQTSGGFRIST